jgi:threonine aldolase
VISTAADNWAGAHPEVLDALIAANSGEEMSYGRDRYTTRLQQIIKSEFGPSAEAFPVFNGTGANVVALRSMQPTWGGVICAHTAHINADEGGAPERVAGLKMLAARTDDGKLTCAHISELAHNFGDVHHAQPSVVSITQSTELGTIYTPYEIAEVSALAHGHGMAVYLDGARLANVAAALRLPLRT